MRKKIKALEDTAKNDMSLKANRKESNNALGKGVIPTRQENNRTERRIEKLERHRIRRNLVIFE